MLPHPTDLHYFLEVYSTKNISRAAERLGITQPSLSISIKRLEENIGAQLLLRSKTGVQTTKAGNQLAAKARKLTEYWEVIKSSALDQKEKIAGHYSIGCHPSVAAYTLPYFLPTLSLDYPDLHIKIEHDVSRNITEGVIQFRIDFAIVVNPVSHPDLVIHPICKDDVYLWTTIKNKHKNQESVLIFDPNLIQSQSIIQQLRQKKIKFNKHISTSSLEVVRQLTVSGCGIGILPKRVATMDTKKRLKKYSPNEQKSYPVFHDNICLIYRKDFQQTMAGKWIVKTIKESIPSK